MIRAGRERNPMVRTAEEIVASLGSPDLAVAKKAVLELGVCLDAGYTPYLYTILARGDKYLQAAAFRALAMLNDPKAMPHVIDVFRKAEPELVYPVMDCLVSMGDYAVIDLVAIVVDDNSRWDLRRRTALVLAEIGPERVSAVLKERLLRLDDAGRRAVITLFDEIEASKITADISEFLRIEVREQTPFQIGTKFSIDEIRRNESRVRKLLAVLVRMDIDAASKVTFALANFSGDEQVPQITDILLKTRDLKVQAIMIQLLGLLETSASIPYLKKFINHSDRRIRSNTVEALARTKDNRVIQLIYPLTHDPDNRVRANAAKAIWEFGGLRAIEVLVQMMKNPDPILRSSGAYALGEIGTIHVVESLLGAIEDGVMEVRRNVVKALGKTGDTLAVGPLKGRIFSMDEEPEVKGEALRALGKIDRQACVDTAMVVIDDARSPLELRRLADTLIKGEEETDV